MFLGIEGVENRVELEEGDVSGEIRGEDPLRGRIRITLIIIRIEDER